MTEKRFTVNRFIEDYKSQIIDNEGKIETLSEFVDYLNEQYKTITRLEKENEELKQKIQLLYEDIDFLRVFIEKQGFVVKLDSDAE